MTLIKIRSLQGKKFARSFFFFNLKNKRSACEHQVGRLAQIQHIEVIFLETSRDTEFWRNVTNLQQKSGPCFITKTQQEQSNLWQIASPSQSLTHRNNSCSGMWNHSTATNYESNQRCCKCNLARDAVLQAECAVETRSET